ncbi:MAG: transcription-repair coupling factor [Victivallaceae bacterium]
MDSNPLKLDSFLLSNIRIKLSQDKSLLIENITGASKAFLASWIFKNTDSHVIFITDDTGMDTLSEDIFAISGIRPKEFPSSDRELSINMINVDAVGQRDQLLCDFLKTTQQHFCITGLKALLEKVTNPETLLRENLTLKIGEKSDPETVYELLLELGYCQVSVTVEKGEMTYRGGIIDVYPLSACEPFRIEFWDDTISSIRSYNPSDQISTGQVTEIMITSAQPIKNHGELTGSVFDYLSENVTIIFDDLELLENKYSELAGTLNRLPGIFRTMTDLLKKTLNHPKIFLSHQTINQESVKSKSEFLLNAFLVDIPSTRVSSPFLSSEQIFLSEQKDDFSLKSILEIVQEKAMFSPDLINIFLYRKKTLLSTASLPEQDIKNVRVHIREENLSSGFYFPEKSVFFISTIEFSSQKVLRRQKQRNYRSSSREEFFVPIPGEIVVHIHNGIGKFKGIRKTVHPQSNLESEYLEIEYADNGTLLVPMSQSHLIMKYVGTSEKNPTLHKIGSSKWSRCKQMTEQSLVEYARHLIQMEAERNLRKAFVYPDHGSEVRLFCDSFPYEETTDQLKAIEDIFSDMCSDKIMDRLICGDAGFGKTEVAMRAAVKAVFDGNKQVIVMTPTTLLAMQHYETFTERMLGLPVRIALLSRYSSNQEIKRNLERIQSGEVDIIIGTHRVISKDVTLKKLGLLIIDEEQRFGVRVKEHLKQLFPEIDCLTLSATPIPRTLYMSLVGARDLSIISVPPSDRLPVSAFICKHDPEIIKAALRHELLRDGQAYIIHNRIETIFEYAQFIQELIPEVKIAVAHGKMTSTEITEVFRKFKTKKCNVLIATAIIENGIDIPNANTIIIDKADHFGLSDLYQMKGRVGRWNKKSYCYFMISSKNDLYGAAIERLEILTKHEHGSGMKVAMHDLELRGSGNILGTDQSGHISAIGFSLYCKLLKKTVKALENKQKISLLREEIKIEFPVISEIPESYIPESSLRLELYQKLGNAETFDEIEQVIFEIRDRFGPLPTSVLWLIELNKLKIFAMKNNFTFIKGDSKLVRADQQHGKQEKIKNAFSYSLQQEPEGFFQTISEKLTALFPSRSE